MARLSQRFSCHSKKSPTRAGLLNYLALSKDFSDPVTVRGLAAHHYHLNFGIANVIDVELVNIRSAALSTTASPCSAVGFVACGVSLPPEQAANSSDAAVPYRSDSDVVIIALL
jgi:hypothetical protein